MIHLQSMFSPETNTSTAGQNTRAPLSEAKLNSFHGALSDAVSSTLEKFGIHPNAVKISVTRSNADPAPPSTGTRHAGAKHSTRARHSRLGWRSFLRRHTQHEFDGAQ